ncbi:hypothetical protein PR048_009129, partial [Dryococelus australis]
MTKRKKDKMKRLDNAKVAFVCFDLQQYLPKPFLSSGLSLYKRYLSTFNLTCFAHVKQRKYAECFMWNETTARKVINVYSDCCGGHTANIYFSVVCILFMAGISKTEKELHVINHNSFTLTIHKGNADSINASTEKTKNTVTSVQINLPKDWMNL